MTVEAKMVMLINHGGREASRRVGSALTTDVWIAMTSRESKSTV